MQPAKHRLKFRMDLHLATWIGSYLLILMIPILLGFSLYGAAVSTLEEEVTKVHEKALNELRLILDNTMAEISRVGTHLCLDPVVAKLAKAQVIDNNVLITAGELQSTIANLLLSNDTIAEAAFFFSNSDYLLTSAHSARAQTRSALAASALEMDQTLFETLTTTVQNNQWYLSPNGGHIYYARSVVVRFKPHQTDGVLILRMKEQEIATALTNTMETIGGDVWLIADGESLRVRSSTLPETLSPFPEKEPDQEQYFFMDQALSQNGWQLRTVASKAHVLGKVNLIRRLLYLHVALCLAAGGVLSYFLARRYYDPIKKITSLLEQQTDGSITHEMGHVYSSMVHLMAESKSQTDTIQQQQETLSRYHLAKVLEGQNQSLANIHFPYPQWVVIGLRCQDKELLLPEDSSGGKEADETSLSALTEKLVQESYVCQTVELRGIVYCVVSLSYEQITQWKPQMALLCQRIQNVFTEAFGITAGMVISTVTHQAEELSVLASQVREALEYAVLLDRPGILAFFEDLFPVIDAATSDPRLAEWESSLCQSLTREDFEEAQGILEELNCSYSAAPMNQARLLKARLYSLVSNVTDALNRLSSQNERYSAVISRVNLLDCHSFAELKERLDDALTQLNHLKEEAGRPRGEDITRRVKEYIAIHYPEPELGVASIAGTFNMSASYLSRLFKKQEGENLLDHLHQVRIAKIKELLSTPATLNQIAEKTGYYNSLAMIRVFKRYEGETPGKYREKLTP